SRRLKPGSAGGGGVLRGLTRGRQRGGAALGGVGQLALTPAALDARRAAVRMLALDADVEGCGGEPELGAVRQPRLVGWADGALGGVQLDIARPGLVGGADQAAGAMRFELLVRLLVDGAEHRLGEIQQRRAEKLWCTRREHVFEKVVACSDGIARASRRESE